MLLLLDNYDSFTYNLVQYLEALGVRVNVVRNDAYSVAELQAMAPRYIVISPGPGSPGQAGISVALIRQCGPSIPILGVCLGHQAIAQAYGGKICPAETVMHGKTSRIFHSNRKIFAGLPHSYIAMRYHSLVVDSASLPDCLEVTAWTNGVREPVIMGLRHKEYPVEGIQFHPESFLTEHGQHLLGNFLHSYQNYTPTSLQRQ